MEVISHVSECVIGRRAGAICQGMTTPAPDIAAIHASVALRGVLATAALLRTNRESLLRLLAGLPVRRGTLALIHQNLSALTEAGEATKAA